jgi:hypothetical protein
MHRKIWYAACLAALFTTAAIYGCQYPPEKDGAPGPDQKIAAAVAPASPGGIAVSRAAVRVNDGWCGDYECSDGEACSCPQDCPGSACCGDGYCDSSEVATCSADCHCGNGACEPNLSENSDTCSVDCPHCGNGACDHGEDRDSCPGDCGYCGDGTCQSDHESASSCPEDCHGCGHDLECFPSLRDCEESCCGVCERRINCGGASAHKCFE